MNFLSITFGLFLLSVLGLYWSVEGRLKLWILLVSSLVFYSSLQVQYVPLLLVMLFITYWLGLSLQVPIEPAPGEMEPESWQFAQQDWNRNRSRLLVFGIGLNVLLLLGFKYVPFLLTDIGGALGVPGAESGAAWFGRHVVAPLGISFFCFECIAYLIDVYRGAPPTIDWLKFSAYKLFFPKLISGPITRFYPFVGQFPTLRFPRTPQIVEGIWLIACGAVKKLLLADHLATPVNLIFDNVERAGSGDLWLAIAAYGLQLYLDFSGYVDVARGASLLLGLELPQNFNFPYFCTSIADFWRRWHMTLGDWLRNYLYFPLGGSRRGLGRTCLNLLLIMLIAGIWHGAAWGFVVWGGLHGLFLVVHRLTDTLAKQRGAIARFWQSTPGVVTGWLVTQLAVFLAWVFFRLPNLNQSWLVMQRLWGYRADLQFGQLVYVDALGSDRITVALQVGAVFVGMGVAYLFHRGLKLHLSLALKLLLIPTCLLAAWLLAPSESAPYIYFNF